MSERHGGGFTIGRLGHRRLRELNQLTDPYGKIETAGWHGQPAVSIFPPALVNGRDKLPVESSRLSQAI